MFSAQSQTPSTAEDYLGQLSGHILADPLALRGFIQRDNSEIETEWKTWLPALLPRYLSDKESRSIIPFGEHHAELWDWVWALRLGIKPAPMVCIWPRGGGKSTTAELAGVAVGALNTRRYVLYVCETMERAEDHVGNVAGMLESPMIERFYPHVADKMLNKHGTSKGWRRNRLRTASGFTVDAIGLDVAARGVKLDDVRPDFMIFDDIDGDTDNPAITDKKIATITKKFLPAGSADLAVLAVQNLISPDSIFSRLANVSQYKADFLHGRTISGPFPAVRGLTYEQQDGRYVITGGRPIWQGMDLTKCQEHINEWGLTAFLAESQQEVDVAPGGMFSHLAFRHCLHDDVPGLVRVVVWVDPAVTDKDTSDSHGIQVDGIAEDDTIYRLFSWEQRASPRKALVTAIMKAHEYGALAVGVETDQGGDTWQELYTSIVKDLRSDEGVTIDDATYRLPEGARTPAFHFEKAGGGYGPKTHRASQMLGDYERGRFVHVVGTHQSLERALKRFPKTKPFDLVDAAFWCWHDLAGSDGLPYAYLRKDSLFRKTTLEPETLTDEERVEARRRDYLNQ